MRDVEEYTLAEHDRCMEHACKLAMCYIEDKYHDLKDENEVLDCEIHGLKCAVEILTHASKENGLK